MSYSGACAAVAIGAFLTAARRSAAVRRLGVTAVSPAAAAVRRGRLRLGRHRRRRQATQSLGQLLRALADSIEGGEALGTAALRVGSAGSGAAARALAGFGSDCLRGGDIPVALDRLTARPEGDIWVAMALAVSLHTRCGGDLPGSLRSIARTVEDAIRAEEESRSATAQARFTANLVSALPLLALLIAALVMPGRMAAVGSSPVSLALLTLAAAVQGTSMLAIRALSTRLSQTE